MENNFANYKKQTNYSVAALIDMYHKEVGIKMDTTTDEVMKWCEAKGFIIPDDEIEDPRD